MPRPAPRVPPATNATCSRRLMLAIINEPSFIYEGGGREAGRRGKAAGGKPDAGGEGGGREAGRKGKAAGGKPRGGWRPGRLADVRHAALEGGRQGLRAAVACQAEARQRERV